jgi:alpha-galactosidase
MPLDFQHELQRAHALLDRLTPAKLGAVRSRLEVMVVGFRQVELAQYAGPGHWSDPDMLEVGNGGMNNDEYITHFTLWAMAAAPLIAGNDVRRMSPATLDILLNKEMIAIDQDPLGAPGRLLSKKDGLEIWTRSLSGGAFVVAFFNLHFS